MDEICTCFDLKCPGSELRPCCRISFSFFLWYWNQNPMFLGEVFSSLDKLSLSSLVRCFLELKNTSKSLIWFLLNNSLILDSFWHLNHSSILMGRSFNFFASLFVSFKEKAKKNYLGKTRYTTGFKIWFHEIFLGTKILFVHEFFTWVNIETLVTKNFFENVQTMVIQIFSKSHY